MFAFLALSSLDLMDRARAASRQPAHRSYPGKGEWKGSKCSVVNTTGMLSRGWTGRNAAAGEKCGGYSHFQSAQDFTSNFPHSCPHPSTNISLVQLRVLYNF